MRKFFLAAAVAVAFLANSVSTAQAGFQVTFVVDATSATIVDGGAGDADLTADGNIVVLSKLINGYTFNVTLTSSNTPNTGGAISFVQHGTNNITGSGAKTIQIIASANGFVSPTGDLYAVSGSTGQFLSPTPTDHTADYSYTAYLDNSNVLATAVPAGTLIGSDGAVTITSPAGNANLGDVRKVNATDPYALTLGLKAKLNSTGVNVIDLDGGVQLSAVPAPAGLVLGLIGMPILGVGAWIRRRRIPTAA
jgi:hypothetical protein